MERRLNDLAGISDEQSPAERASAAARLYAIYAKGGGDRRSESTLQDEGYRRLHELRERGFDLGGIGTTDAATRVEALYTHARSALYACIDPSVVRDASLRTLSVRSQARDRDDYLAHPEGGERLRPQDRRAIADLYAGIAPQVLMVISDGLNANAVNEHLRAILPLLRRLLADGDCHVAGTDILVENGRVRVGYEIGELTAADVLIHLIGERPGTGLNTLSAYVTYGRDGGGRMRWNRALDHAVTNAICGIHPRGKPVDVAASEIARTVRRIRQQRRSGVGLNPSTAKFRPPF
jgi:ethanolamine ammonia-lyase large subunit